MCVSTARSVNRLTLRREVIASQVSMASRHQARPATSDYPSNAMQSLHRHAGPNGRTALRHSYCEGRGVCRCVDSRARAPNGRRSALRPVGYLPESEAEEGIWLPSASTRALLSAVTAPVDIAFLLGPIRFLGTARSGPAASSGRSRRRSLSLLEHGVRR
jgi:hypothetical protein